jgi:4-amino-4-deoxy-L-arabinose transferase-like glycosyltransferase
MFDVPLSAALVFAMLGLVDSSWLLFGASMGAAFLIKGPSAVVALAAAALFAAFDLRGRAKTVAFGAALALLTERPWVRRAVALLAFVTILQSAGSDLIQYGRFEDSEATRTVLAALPPPDRAPMLQVAMGIPAETARFYAHRPIDWCESPSRCLGWLLVRADQVTYFGPRLTVAISGRRALLGPVAEEN